jgi:serine/threonine protein kinase
MLLRPLISRTGLLDTMLSVSLKGGLIEIGRSLGQGTFGKVRIGTHTITNESVAIKILEKDKIKDKSDVERVTREINILKKVRHPNVI